MYNYKTKKLPKNTTEINVDIPKADIAKEYDLAFEKIQKELAIEGFRKGKVPKAIAQKHIAKDKVYQELVRSLLPRIYEEVIKKEGLTPIFNPRVELVKAKENEDWQVRVTVAEKPIVELNDYKEIVKKVKAEKKKADIWVPGKEEKKPENATANQQMLLNDILAALLDKIKIEISDLIIDEELNQRLSRLVDDVQKIGLTTESYLKSKGLTMEELKKRYSKEIADTYKLEFMLMAIADKEGISVEKADLDKLFANIKDEKERQMAQSNAYFYASILRKQKALDFILGL